MNPIVGDLRVVRCCIALIICLFFSSCSKQQPQQQKTEIDQQLNAHRVILDNIAQQEAMLVDIPIPFYDERIISSHSDRQTDTLVFGYKSPFSWDQAVDFFMQQMERHGWQHLVTFDATDIILQFSSPNRYCTVVIENYKHEQSYSCIFIYIKKASS